MPDRGPAAARKRINLRTDEVIMIGDTMDTGIRGANDLGFRSILVLTGSTTTETLKDYPFAPTHVVRCITDVAATRRQLTLSTG